VRLPQILGKQRKEPRQVVASVNYLFSSGHSLVEHFKFFSEKIGEKCPLFFTRFFTENTGEKPVMFSPLFHF
jgi:hypothetical protein